MPRLGSIELSQLPVFQVLETISTEDIITARMQQLVAYWMAGDPPQAAQYDVENLEFDPIKINQECSTYFELMLRDRVNQAARAVTLAYAIAGDLDAIASRYPGGLPRITPQNDPSVTTPETDPAYRTRIWLSPNTLTQNGVYENYIFFSLTAAQLAGTPLRDCQALSTPGDPNIYIYIMADGTPVSSTQDGNGNYTNTYTAFPSPIPTNAQILTVLDYIEAAGEGRKGATDVIHVLSPKVVSVDYNIEIELFPGWDEALTLQPLYNAIATLIESQRYLGYSHTRSAIDAVLKVSGVSSVNVISPPVPANAADPDILVPVTANEIVVVDSINISFSGRAGIGPLPPNS